MTRIEIREAYPSPNVYLGRHWKKYYDVKRRLYRLIYTAVVSDPEARKLINARLQKAYIHIERYGKQMDDDNLMAGAKPVIDILRCPTKAEERSAVRLALKKGRRPQFYHLNMFLDDSPDHLALSAEQAPARKNKGPSTVITVSSEPIQGV